MRETLYNPGENGGAVPRARRVSFVVDADGYFRLFRRAAERAECAIGILAWDFDSRTVLEQEDGKAPIVLGDFLNGVALRKRRLRMRILDWDYPIVCGPDREIPPTRGLTWKPHRHIDFRFDDTHPVAGSHHQKIVLVDGRLAFVGGLDLTNKRWDTCDHKADEPRRMFDNEPYPPFHDVMIAVDGEAVDPLVSVMRERWRGATDEDFKPVKADTDPWPDIMPVHVENARVAVSLTAPPTGSSAGVKQVEALYLDMIMAARRYIYIENQYFTSEVIGEALKARLAEPGGPEIVVVTRLLSHGWLQEKTMSPPRPQPGGRPPAAHQKGRLPPHLPERHGPCRGN